MTLNEPAGGAVSAPPGRNNDSVVETNRRTSGGGESGSPRRGVHVWLVRHFRANRDVVVVQLPLGPVIVEVEPGTEGSEPACRCYRCGVLLTVDAVEASYVTGMARPACGECVRR